MQRSVGSCSASLYARPRTQALPESFEQAQSTPAATGISLILSSALISSSEWPLVWCHASICLWAACLTFECRRGEPKPH